MFRKNTCSLITNMWYPVCMRKDFDHLIFEVMDAVRASTGLDIRVTDLTQNHSDGGIDAFVCLNDKTICPVIIKRWAAQYGFKKLVEIMEMADVRPLLIADYINESLGSRLRDDGYEYMDATGNVFLCRQDLRVLVQGRKPSRQDVQSTGQAFGTAGLRILTLLLCNPDRWIGSPYREISETAGVSLGSVSTVFRDLINSGFIGKLYKNKVFRQRRKLLFRWAERYVEKLKPKLIIGTFSSKYDSIPMDILRANDCLAGGELAASHMGLLHPAKLTIYTRSLPLELVRALHLGRDPRGRVELVQFPWNKDAQAGANSIPNMVPTTLIFADLKGNNEPRSDEVAGEIYNQYLARYFDRD